MHRLLLAPLLLSGCSAWHSVGRFVSQPEYAAAVPTGELGTVTIYEHGEERGFAPEEVAPGLGRALPLRRDAVVEFMPHEAVQTELFVRRTGADESGFVPVVSETGVSGRRIPLEVRFFGREPDDAPVVVDLRDLQNPHNGYRLSNRDLLLVSVRDATQSEQYLFQLYDIGVRTSFGAGVLVPTTLPGLVDDVGGSPALALSMSIGYRFREVNTGSRVADALSVVLSAGVGSTVLDQEGPLEDQVTGAFNAAVVGGGVSVFRFVSLQGLVNVSSLFRDGEESTVVPVVGFDAVEFARFSRRAAQRLFGRNELRLPPE